MASALPVTGIDGRRNTLDIVAPDEDGAEAGAEAGGGAAAPVLVFFPGDISATAEAMRASPQVKDWVAYSWEGMARLLARRFSTATVVLVRPSRQQGIFSCFRHFLDCDDYGDPVAPNGAPTTVRSVAHLSGLLSDAARQLEGKGKMERVAASLRRGRVHLCGFSKGCAPVFQLFKNVKTAAAAGDCAATLLHRIASWIWLDPGMSANDASRGRGVLFPQQEHAAAFKSFVDVDVAGRPAAEGEGDEKEEKELLLPRLAMTVSPRQFADPTRTWLPEAFGAFRGHLADVGLVIELEKVCYDRPASLAAHFAVLELFTTLLAKL